MKLDVLKIDGSKSGDSVELSDEIFGIEPNDHVIYLAVKAYLANQRQGTHKTKERNEVRGGGRKPWRQKGRGVARAGTIRSPLWVGGGKIFGPKPRNYRQKLNKKVKSLARKSALSYKAKAEQIFIVEDFNFETPKSKELNAILNALKVSGKKTLILTSVDGENVYKSGRNIEKVNVLEANKASAYEILNSQILLLQKGALEKLESTLN
ncbi:MAG: 50S ribosomal protein L4 [Ignavibacteriae bacterium]|nr:50S ribosomal protein L4 [Ignavibacteriota bacterium]NOG97574.1 50S ribosomal protein L4 [Ignavibacteriota bacterium]